MNKIAAAYFEAARVVALDALGSPIVGAALGNAPAMRPRKARKILRRGTAIEPPKIGAGDAELALLPRLAGAYATRGATFADQELDAAVFVDCAGIIGFLALSVGEEAAKTISVTIDQRAQDLVTTKWPSIVALAEALLDKNHALVPDEIERLLAA